MIKRLKLRFLLLAMSALAILLTVTVTAMNVINYTSVTREADEVLALLSQNRGAFPGFEGGAPRPPEVAPEGDSAPPDKLQSGRLPHNMSPELPYESRYFSVLLDANGNALQVDTGRIAAVDRDQAVAYALSVEDDRGFADDFRYARVEEEGNLRITFLHCRRQLDAFYNFLLTSCLIALGSFLLMGAVMLFCAGRIIRPIAESYEKQKRFITDAGHEIKTPLTIINANVDLLEMEQGESESLSDIRQQAKRLTTLTNDLVYLARMEESEKRLCRADFPISEIVQESAAPFGALAEAQGKRIDCRITPALSFHGDPKSIEQLVSILMDNALKYSPADSCVELTLKKQGRQLLLTLRNATAEPVDREALPRIFDRFYRADGSRNSQTGGHGIGLSVAKAIVTAHGGRISAFAVDDHTFGITAVFSA